MYKQFSDHGGEKGGMKKRKTKGNDLIVQNPQEGN